MAKEVFNRFEHKYLLDRNTYEKVLDIIDGYMLPDKYNLDGKPYTISNIYYDTDDDFLIRNSLSKPVYKEKLRLRAYGVPKFDDKVFLEIKKKYKGIVNKRRTSIFLSDAYSFVENGVVTKFDDFMNRQVTNEITYFLQTYIVKPKLYLAYDRIAFFEKDNSALRISFDTNIRARRYDLRLEYGDYGEKIISDNLYLMEIKSELTKPLWVCRMLSDLDIKRQRFSKYGTEYKIHIMDSKEDTRCVVNG